ncbi:ABC transporter permease [Martelella mediterranea]|uniref:Carnitine transport permease protein OpuCB n=1 Tax=Martelella mediterranea DSM 17316 TaxID=1122214 RepID=A0A1U9Z850_9HYPH|nr:ABC transporter permease [Martelella mediterranea]AQZ53875.1 Carnitine transport permease protein OpuCB [Martelella mediterranea DSM 17316]
MKWLPRHLDDVGEALLQHLYLVVVSVGIALAISLVIGIWTAHRPKTFNAALMITGVLFAIPSLALFALFIPVLGIGAAPAITGLSLYSLMILIRNIGLGFQSIPADVMEAAHGMGYGSFRRLWEVELPIALPFIVGGIRIATVTVIGIATVAAYINAGGLGAIIFQGIDQRFPEKIIVGGLLTSALALSADYALSALETRLRRRSGRPA